MKRLWIGVGLLLVMLPLGIWISFRFAEIYGPMAQLLEKAGEAAQEGNWDTAEEELGKAKALWNQWEKFSAAIADHEPLEEMEALFGKLESSLQMEDGPRFTSFCRELAALAEAMAESQSIHWWTLL